MKYVLVIGDGMADRPIEELGGKTPLQVAKKPSMDWVASKGKSGFLKNVPDEMKPNSDVAIMSLMGYDPLKYYTGRGPLEAAGMDITLDSDEVAFRCNLITEGDNRILDYSAGHISTKEAEELISLIDKKTPVGKFYAGVDYRHLLLIKYPSQDIEEMISTPPHDIIGEDFEENLLKPKEMEIARVLNDFILDSREILSDHPINRDRVKNGKRPANSIWLWGQGRKPDFEPFLDRYGVKGAVISAVTLVKGLGKLAGMDSIDVPGATGYYDTDYESKADYALKALDEHDLVIVHVEAPDEAGHSGDIKRKIEAIENLDERLLKRILDNIEGEYTIVVTADHPTPISVKNHVSDPVPFCFFSSRENSDGLGSFDEESALRGSEGVLNGHELMRKILDS